jgi:hypothetical protein
VPGDYDGDGRSDFAVWRRATGVWFVIGSAEGSAFTREWGSADAPYLDIPVPDDYDADGITDLAVWRRSTGTWYAIGSSDGGTISRNWGAGYDPYADAVPAASAWRHVNY